MSKTTAWEPLQDATMTVNGRIGSAMAAYSGEWVDFLNRRYKQDVALARRLAAAKSPVDVWQAYSEFWAAAAADYQREALELSRLGCAAMAACPQAMQECAKHVIRDSAAKH